MSSAAIAALRLNITTSWTNSADDKTDDIFLTSYSQKTGFDISWKLSPMEIIYNLHEMPMFIFCEKIRTNISKCRLHKFLASMLSINEDMSKNINFRRMAAHLWGGNSELFWIPSEKGSSLKGKICWKDVYSKRKEFAPTGSKFFPFRADPFSDGAWSIQMQTGSYKSYLPCTNDMKSTKCSTPLNIKIPPEN